MQPGGQARVTLTVTNTGTRVEGYDLRVVGPTAPWARVEPAQLSVYPQESGTAEVVFFPPIGTTVPGGLHPFGALVRSTLDPLSSSIAEGDVKVEKVPGLDAKITPVTSAGRWRGQHAVHLSNRGNTVAHLRMTATDPDEAIGFYLSPAEVTLPPGGQATVRIFAQARRPFLRGTPQRLPFEVVGEPADRPPGARPPGPGYGDPSRPVVAGAFNQKPILSAGLVTVLLGVLAVTIALGFYLQSLPERAEAVLAVRDAPPRPVVTVSDVGPTSVRLRWDPVESADGYEVQQVDGEDSVQEYPPLGEVNVFEPPNLPSSTKACFRVRALRGGAKGPWSESVCDTTAAPTAPPMTSAPASATPTLPPRDDLPPLRATRAVFPVVVDGDMSEWMGRPFNRADQPIVGNTSTGDIYLMWDEAALYLLALVRDPAIKAIDANDPARAWRGDAVVLELGRDNSQLTPEARARQDDAYYLFGLAPKFEQPQPTGLLQNPQELVITGKLQPNLKGDSFDQFRPVPGIIAAASRVEGGYIVEAAIPWLTSGLIGAMDTQLAANVVVSDRNPTSFENLGMVSTNKQRTLELRARPFYWQRLTLGA